MARVLLELVSTRQVLMHRPIAVAPSQLPAKAGVADSLRGQFRARNTGEMWREPAAGIQ